MMYRHLLTAALTKADRQERTDCTPEGSDYPAINAPVALVIILGDNPAEAIPETLLILPPTAARQAGVWYSVPSASAARTNYLAVPRAAAWKDEGGRLLDFLATLPCLTLGERRPFSLVVYCPSLHRHHGTPPISSPAWSWNIFDGLSWEANSSNPYQQGIHHLLSAMVCHRMTSSHR
jgi:hypothetical protein